MATKDARTVRGARKKGSRTVAPSRRLFTFIVEHEGASSVSQVFGVDEVDALTRWRGELTDHLGEIMSARQLRWMSETLNAPNAITGRTGVWSVCGLTRSPEIKRRGGVAEIFVVATAGG